MSALFTGLMHMPYGLGTMLGIGVMSRAFLPRFAAGCWWRARVMLIAGRGRCMARRRAIGPGRPWARCWC
jgi:hypothetical protein